MAHSKQTKVVLAVLMLIESDDEEKDDKIHI